MRASEAIERGRIRALNLPSPQETENELILYRQSLETIDDHKELFLPTLYCKETLHFLPLGNQNLGSSLFPVHILRIAIEADNFEACEYLLDQGEDPFLFEHASAMAYALENKLHRYVRLFLKHSTPEKLNKKFNRVVVKTLTLRRNRAYWCFLNIAVSSNDLLSVELLLQHKSSVFNDLYISPLAIAAFYGFKDILLLLLRHGAALSKNDYRKSDSSFIPFTAISILERLSAEPLRYEFNQTAVTLLKELSTLFFPKEQAPNLVRRLVQRPPNPDNRVLPETLAPGKINKFEYFYQLIETFNNIPKEPFYVHWASCPGLREYLPIWTYEIRALIKPYRENLELFMLGYARLNKVKSGEISLPQGELPHLACQALDVFPLIISFALPSIKSGGLLIRSGVKDFPDKTYDKGPAYHWKALDNGNILLTWDC